MRAVTALASLLVAWWTVGAVALASWGEPWAAFLLAASVLYPLGSIAVTRAFHIPRNDALAELDPERAESGRYWSRYVGVLPLSELQRGSEPGHLAA